MKRKAGLLLTIAALLLVSIVMVKPSQCQEAADDIIIDDINEDSSMPETGTILQTIANNKSLETFMGFLEQVGLIDMLKGDGPYTLFIPDDSAFSGLPDKELERMEYSDKFVKTTLLRHIVEGKVIVFADEEKRTVQTAGGEEISVVATEELVQIENATIIDEEIECSNGVIHIIDAVIMPKKVER